MLGDAKQGYLGLEEVAGREKASGLTNSFHIALLKSIDSRISVLKTRYDYGTQIPKRNMPRKYLELRGVTNLWD